ncbi:hypothetical protein NDU88_004376 [Pleurodeles waltl]|uniref:Uncharacterized protein n=1 Tax=Pleurodeles waltl TaxID=8319 RepID=A0AAV7L0T7_PLEWA|nr:hypothetical protein NDU88_004376 [Pleurodeles waltl]
MVCSSPAAALIRSPRKGLFTEGCRAAHLTALPPRDLRDERKARGTVPACSHYRAAFCAIVAGGQLGARYTCAPQAAVPRIGAPGIVLPGPRAGGREQSPQVTWRQYSTTYL